MTEKGFAPLVLVVIIAFILITSGGFYYIDSYPSILPSTLPTPTPFTLLPTNTPEPPIPIVSTQPKLLVKPTSTPTPTPKPTLTQSTSVSKTSSTNPNPICEIDASYSSNYAPMKVNFSAGAKWNTSTTAYITQVQWDYDGDGTWDTTLDSSNQKVTYTYGQSGNYTAKMHLTDSTGHVSDVCTRTLNVNAPSLTCAVQAYEYSGTAPFTGEFYYGASFNGGSSNDYVTEGQWDFNGDGNWETPYNYDSLYPNYTFENPGTYTIKMHLKSNKGLESNICTGTITVH